MNKKTNNIIPCSSLDRYFKEMSEYSLLTREQENELGRKLCGENDFGYNKLINEDSFVLAYFYAHFESERRGDKELKQSFDILKFNINNTNCKKNIENKVDILRNFYQSEEENSRIFQSYIGMINNYFGEKPLWDNKNFTSDLKPEESSLILPFLIDPYKNLRLKKNYLLVKIQSELAKNDIVNANLRLVISLAKKFSKKTSYPFEDLIQEGNTGLIKSVNKFDYLKGFKFSTYSSWWIKQAIQRSITECNPTIRIPCYKDEQVKKINYIKALVENSEHGFSEKLFIETAKDYLNIDETNAKNLLTLSNLNNLSYLDDKISDNDSGSTLKDFLKGEDSSNIEDTILESELKDSVKEVLDTLDTRERMIIKMRFGLNGYEVHSLQNIGDNIGLTRERVRQIEKKTLQQLGRPKRRKLIKGFL